MEVRKMGSIRLLTMDEKPANSLTPEILHELAGLLRDLEKDREARTVVLCSRIPTLFSSGVALRELTSKTRTRASLSLFWMVHQVYRIVKGIRSSRLIYIASLHGAVIGSAVSLAAACDFRFASESTWFWLPDPLYGGLLADGGLTCIREWVGVQGAYRFCMTNARISLREAQSLGFVSPCPEADILPMALEFAKNLGHCAESTLYETKRLLRKRRGLSFPWRQLIRITASEDWRDRLQEIQTKGNKGHEASRENHCHNRRHRWYR